MTPLKALLTKFFGNKDQILCPYCFEFFSLKAGISGNLVLCTNTSCRRTLPNNALDFKAGLRGLTISVIGARNAGKSHYIASLIHCIREGFREFSWSIRGMDDQTIARYREDFFDRVFVQKVAIDATRRSSTDARTKEPLSFILSFLSKNRRSLQPIYLSFYDTAGETLNQEDLISRESKYVYNADGIIVLLDPLQLPGVRKELEDKVTLPRLETTTDDIIARTANLIRKAKNIPQTKPIGVPLAVAFSKIDMLLPLFPQGNAMQYASKHHGHFSPAEFNDIDGEMRAALHRWGSHSLIGSLEADFPNHGFFGISSLGSNPDERQRIPTVAPLRVLDPFVWQLHRFGRIKSRD